MKNFLFFSILLLIPLKSPVLVYGKSTNWGFKAHEIINELAVYSLPSPLSNWFFDHIPELKAFSTLPDKKRYVVPDEAPRHFIDIETYDSAHLFPYPLPYDSIISLFPEKILAGKGILPWSLRSIKTALTKAFILKDRQQIIRLAGTVGHYLSDASVPLHTTENYNGQKTDQQGIHGLFESRIIELFSDEFILITQKAAYVRNLDSLIWTKIIHAHTQVEFVLEAEKKLDKNFPDDLKFVIEKKKSLINKTYSAAYSQAYLILLNGLIESQMKSSINLTATFWYTCWVDAGMPDL